MRESRTFGSVRGGDGNIPTYSDGLLDFAFGSPCLVGGKNDDSKTRRCKAAVNSPS